ncbi:hypothetical protein D3C85_1920370 [compost metagenome]
MRSTTSSGAFTVSSKRTSRKAAAGIRSRTAMLWRRARAMRLFHCSPTWAGSAWSLYICQRV